MHHSGEKQDDEIENRATPALRACVTHFVGMRKFITAGKAGKRRKRRRNGNRGVPREQDRGLRHRAGDAREAGSTAARFFDDGKACEAAKVHEPGCRAVRCVSGSRRTGTRACRSRAATVQAGRDRGIGRLAGDGRPRKTVSAVRNMRIVIINETHDSQQPRGFSFLLARTLKREGFSHLGFEAIAVGKAQQLKRLGPTTDTGFYTFDAFLADYIRQGLAWGYEVFDYEERPGQEVTGTDVEKQNARERAQAKNIQSILSANTNARILLHVGGSHGAKLPQRNGVSMMARQLGEMTGLNVLSIEQGAGTPSSSPANDTPLYQAVATAIAPETTTVFRKRDGTYLTASGYDMVVFHPRMPGDGDRGRWMTLNGHRQAIAIRLAPLAERTVIRAWALPNAEKSLAMDQVLVSARDDIAHLYLPVGSYLLTREFETGRSEKLGTTKVR